MHKCSQIAGSHASRGAQNRDKDKTKTSIRTQPLRTPGAKKRRGGQKTKADSREYILCIYIYIYIFESSLLHSTLTRREGFTLSDILDKSRGYRRCCPFFRPARTLFFLVALKFQHSHFSSSFIQGHGFARLKMVSGRFRIKRIPAGLVDRRVLQILNMFVV